MKSSKVYYGFLVLTVIIFSLNLKAQDDFQLVWESEFSVNAKGGSYTNGAGDRVFGTNDKECSMLNGEGKELWGGKYKDISTNGVNNSDYRYCAWEADVYFVFDKKLGADRVTAIDTESGKELWNSDRYQNLSLDNIEYISELESFILSLKDRIVLIKAKTGEEVWETDRFRGSIGKYLYLPDEGDILMINFKPTLLGALFTGFKNQFVRIDASNGNIKWDASYRGLVEKKVISREPLVSISRVDNKVFLYMNGLQVFDLESGESLWTAVYDADPTARKGFVKSAVPGKPIKVGVYGMVADPLVTEDHVYIVLGDDKGKNKYIQKIDIHTGEVIWTSEKIDKANALPNLIKVGNTLVAQIGGLVEIQSVSNYRNSDGSITTYRIIQYEFMGKFGLAGIDDSNGQYVWRSEKFKKRITNIIADGDNIYAASGVAFYCLDAYSGKEIFNVEHKRAGVGKPFTGIDKGNKIVMICDNGVTAFDKKDGNQLYKTDKFKGITNYYTLGENFFVQNSGNDKLAGIDLENGNIKGVIKAKGKGGGSVYGDGIDITNDGEYIYWFKGKKVEKYKVNK